jgi:hypothetical protein
MSKVAAALVTVVLLASTAAPSFAASHKPKGKIISSVTTSITYGCSKARHR